MVEGDHNLRKPRPTGPLRECKLTQLLQITPSRVVNFSHVSRYGFNTLKPRQNGRYFADDIFKCIFLNENA